MRSGLTSLALAAALLTGAASARGAVLQTPPLPATALSAGFVGCQLTNVGTKDGQAVVELIDNLGEVVQTGDVTVAPGATSSPVGATVAPPNYPTRCRFTVKGRFKAAAYWYQGTSAVVVPAER